MKHIDIHSHIHDKAFDNSREDLINKLKENEIYTITIGTDYESSLAAKKLAEANENIYYTIGMHPCDGVSVDSTSEQDNVNFDENKFKDLLGPKCVAIGECGLDYYYLYKEISNKIENATLDKSEINNNKDKIIKEKERQKDLFIKQINFARENNLPLMLHGRPSEKNEIDNIDGMDAYWDMIDMLTKAIDAGPSPDLSPQRRGENAKQGNVHFFVGNIEIAKKFLDLGFDFSLGGVLTITREYDDMVKYLPVERIHAETDSPYVVPRDTEGKRVSKINSPLNIEIIIEKIAEIKNISVTSLREQLIFNFKNLYNISL